MTIAGSVNLAARATQLVGSRAGVSTGTSLRRHRVAGAVRPSARRLRVSAGLMEEAQNESARVLERTKVIHDARELDAELVLAGDNLVILSVESDEECTISDDSWAGDVASGADRASMDMCKSLSASLARMARDADDVTFLTLQVCADDQARALASELQISVFPTQQYYRGGQLIWQRSGAGAAAEAAISEGLLYYGGQGAQGLNTSELISEVGDKAQLEEFLGVCAPPQPAALGFADGFDVPCDKQLAIVDVGQAKNAPAGCLHIFPAVVSLARNTAGFTRWARLDADASVAAAALVKELGVEEVPTFLFYADGKLVDRYVGSDRLALMNSVLNFQTTNGVVMPQRTAPRRMTNAEAREVAKAARERARREAAEKLF